MPKQLEESKSVSTDTWQNQSGVCHVVLADDGSYALPDTPKGLIVFWWDGRPVAHRWSVEPAPAPLIGQVDAQMLETIADEERRGFSAQLDVSVVICTRDRPQELQRCLATLPQQTYPPREIIVVDNASKHQRTRAVAMEAGVIYLREDRPGLDFARNTGASYATSQIVAYTDDDVILHPNWLEGLVSAFDDPRIGAVTGLVLPAELATEAQLHFETYWSFGQGYNRKDFHPNAFAACDIEIFPAWKVGAGASMAFRRDMFDRVGYFDTRLDAGQAGCSGDSEFWYRLLAKGFSCRYEPSSVAFHFHRRTMEGLSSQIFQYMRGHATALLVQYERTGIASNRSQAFLRMPWWYCQRIVKRLRGRASAQDRFLKEEILGYLAGIVYYYLAGKSDDELR
ncbi:glycosyltransferase [Cyanobium sp. Candia 9D4]|nr:glycosyltransferase [Cyanobium sp. Candia 9D4]